LLFRDGIEQGALKVERVAPVLLVLHECDRHGTIAGDRLGVGVVWWQDGVSE
jgi:hypothetical protein